MRLEAQAKGGYYPTPLSVVSQLIPNIGPALGANGNRHGVLRILDPCAGTGAALKRLGESLSNIHRNQVETFGVELHGERAMEAEQNLTHSLSCDIFQTAIANHAFGILLLNPPYDTDQDYRRAEHNFLTHCTRFLEERGILIFIIPRSRLPVSARFLAANYDNLACRWFPEEEREAFDQIIVFGQRKELPSKDDQAEQALKATARQGPENLADAPQLHFRPPAGDPGEILFNTRNIDPRKAAEEAKSSGLWSKYDIASQLWPETTQHTRPLMPLRQGHLAMLAAAGFLNNLVIRDHNEVLIVKSRTVKELHTVEETPEVTITQERLKTTVVSINLTTREIMDIQA